MIIRALEMENIRSYKDATTVNFEPGILLFEGDIGSGKSTILSAVEFALFGLADINPGYLLRTGERRGWVSLEFEVDSKQYKIHRSLIRARKNVTQETCSLTEAGVKTDYSVGELKSRMLEVLDFKEKPHPRASSLIYRYAVFTPQEEMKDVILQDEQRRLETLRRALGLEEYSIALANVQRVIAWIKGEVRFLTHLTGELETKRESLKDEKSRLDALEMELLELKKSHQDLIDKLNEARGHLRKLQPKKEDVLRLEAALPRITGEISSLESTEDSFKRRTSHLTKQLEEVSEAERILRTLQPKFQRLRQAKSELSGLKPKVKEFEFLERSRIRLEESIRNAGEVLEQSVHELTDETAKTEARIAKLEEQLLDIQSLSKHRKQLTQDIDAQSEMLKQLPSLGQERGKVLAGISNAEEELGKKKREWAAIERIGINAPCPRCKQKLTKRHYERVRKDYEKEIDETSLRIKNLSTSREGLEREIEQLSGNEPKLDEQRRHLTEVEANLNRLLERKKSLTEDKLELSHKRRKLELSRKSLQLEDFAQEERNRLATVLGQLKELEPMQERSQKLEVEIQGYEREEIEAEYHKANGAANQKTAIQQQLSEIDHEMVKTREQLVQRRKEFQERSQEYESKKGVLDEITSAEREENELSDRNTQAAEDAASKNGEINSQHNTISAIEEEIDRMEKHSHKRVILEQYLTWLTDFFAPSIQNIERHVFVSINEEFNDLFQNWFGQLIETGDLSVQIDENFTPLVEQSGYELDYLSLSGGEKTSVALAYRLALNVMVKKYCEAMRTNLLILDEPTDGFSREQLGRMREILRQLACDQIIIVSHENELESFVDKIYKVRKEAGRSVVVEA